MNSLISSRLLDPSADTYQGKSIAIQSKRSSLVANNLEKLLTGELDGMQLIMEAQPEWAKYSLEIPREKASLGSLKNIMNFIEQLPEIDCIESICDVGGSVGYISEALAASFSSVKVDLLELPARVPSIKKCLEKSPYYRSIDVYPHDIREDEVPNGDYGLILMADILFLFLEQLEQILSKYSAALASGGYIVISAPTKGISKPKQTECIDTFINGALGFRNSKPVFVDQAKLSRVLSNIGLEVVKSELAGQGKSSLLMAARKHS